jgi:hypothetical protein
VHGEELRLQPLDTRPEERLDLLVEVEEWHTKEFRQLSTDRRLPHTGDTRQEGPHVVFPAHLIPQSTDLLLIPLEGLCQIRFRLVRRYPRLQG